MRVAIVGTGYIAGRHASVLQNEPDIELVGHVDVIPEGAQKAAQEWGGRPYTNVQEMLEIEKPEAVWLGIPPFAHGETEMQCIAAGIPMYIEKPIGTDTTGPEAIASAIRERALLVNTGYYWRCIEVVSTLQNLLAETPPRLVRAAWHGLTPPAAWWQTQSKSGGQIVEQATHLFDLARFLLGEPQVLHALGKLHARPDYPTMDVPTVTAVTLLFGADTVALFSATNVLDHTTDANIEFYCDNRKITLTNKELIITTKDKTEHRPWGDDPLAIADRLFIQAIREQDPSKLVCSYEEALMTQKLCVQVSERAVEAV